MGAAIDLEWVYSYDPTVNDRDMAALARKGIITVLGIDAICDNLNPSMTSEDFAYFLEMVPGAMFWVGAGEKDKNLNLHSATLALSDKVLIYAIKSYIGLIIEFFKQHNQNT